MPGLYQNIETITMTQRIIEGQYYSIGPSGNYTKHSKVNIHCHQQIPPSNNNQEFKQPNGNHQENRISPRFNSPTTNHKKQLITPIPENNYDEQNEALFKSSHTECSKPKEPKLKGILKRSLNSQRDFLNSHQRESNREIQSIFSQRKNNLCNSGSASKRYQDVVNSFKSVNSEIQEDVSDKNSVGSKQMRLGHRRNNSNELSGNLINHYENHPQLREQRFPGGPNRISQKPAISSDTLIQFSPRNNRRNKCLLNRDIHQKSVYLPRNAKSKGLNLRQLTETETLIETDRRREKNNSHQNLRRNRAFESQMLNDSMTHRYNYQDQEGGFDAGQGEDEDQYLINNYSLNLIEQMQGLNDKMLHIEEQLARSEYRIIKYQLERQIRSKDMMLEKLNQENEQIKRQKQTITFPNNRSQQQNQIINYIQSKSHFFITVLLFILVAQLFFKGSSCSK